METMQNQVFWQYSQKKLNYELENLYNYVNIYTMYSYQNSFKLGNQSGKYHKKGVKMFFRPNCQKSGKQKLENLHEQPHHPNVVACQIAS